MESVWSKTAELPRFGALEGERKTDVLVIGGGLAGLLCAYWLDQAGVDYLLLEAETICGGVSQNTTAKITSQHGLIYQRLAARLGLERARMYLDANQQALERYRQLCQGIECEFQRKDAFVYALDSWDKIEKELDTLDKLNFPAGFAGKLPLPLPIAGAVRFPEQAQFHPLKFAAAIARGLRIFEHTKVTELQPGRAVTERGSVRAGQIIAATHFPFLNKHGGYFLKLYQHRSYVLALKNAPDVAGMYVDESETGLSFRNEGELLLLGGGSHRTGQEGGGWKGLEDFARLNYPHWQEEERWATQDCMTLDGMPYVGQYSKATPGLYVATGFNKWGMTSAMAAALLLTDLVQGKENPYAQLFSPSRIPYWPQLAANGAQAVAGLLTPKTPRCPHLGCALHYNREEHSWDCPCHGSRFSRSGELLDNPATHGKRM